MAADVFGLVGSTLDNRYRIDGVVGEGGFGVVYRGWHLAFGHAIAVKCLKVDSRLGAEQRGLFLRKFREEGAFLSRLSQHPAIVRVFDLNVASTPQVADVPYLVLEWLDGIELERHLEQRKQRGLGPMGEAEAIALLRPVVDAIGLAHASRIAHRDLKPANLFLARVAGGAILKVLDFGIAKAMADGEAEAVLSTQTSSGFSAFSPQYGAPEQFRSRRYGATGPWTDVHALGLIFSEILSGRAPYAALELADYYELGTSADRPTPRRLGARVSDALEAVCARALALEPRDRFPDARSLLAALDNIGAGTANTVAAVSGGALAGYLAPAPGAYSVAPAGNASAPPLAPAPGAYSIGPGFTDLGSHGAQPANAASASSTSAVSAAPVLTPTDDPLATAATALAPATKRSRIGIAIGAVALLAAIAGGVGFGAYSLRSQPAKKKPHPIASGKPGASTAPSARAPDDTSAEGLRLYRDRSDPANRAKGLALMKGACDAGYGVGCSGYAWAELYGQGIPKDEAGGRATLEAQCSKGTELACAILGDGLMDGVAGMARNEKRALDLLEHGCKSGTMLACAWLGKAYDQGKAVLKDKKRANDLYEQACAGAELRGCWELSIAYATADGVAKDEKRAAELAQRACNGGDMTGCFLLSLSYLRGGGVPKDDKRAAELCTEACDGYLDIACSKLVAFYANGIGVPKDQKKAFEIADQACREDEALGCYDEGMLYQKGHGVELDMKRAAEAFDQACKGGRMEGCTELGTQYALGQGVARDAKRAAELFDTACTADDAGGCTLLGLATLHGDGVSADRGRAVELLKKGCKGGEHQACETLSSLGESP